MRMHTPVQPMLFRFSSGFAGRHIISLFPYYVNKVEASGTGSYPGKLPWGLNCPWLPGMVGLRRTPSAFRYSLGVVPMISIKARLKLRWLLKPDSAHTSVSGALLVFISCMAYSRRIWFRYRRKFIRSLCEKISEI